MGRRPNRRNKAAFSNFLGVVWTRPQVYLGSDMVSRLHTPPHIRKLSRTGETTDARVESNRK